MKKFFALVLTFAMVFSLAACSSKNATGGDGDAITVKYSVTFSATGVQADGAKELGKLIEEYSSGSMKMELYPSSQLGDKAATFEGLRKGTVEMTESASTDFSSFNSLWSVFSLPYMWESGAQAVKVVMDPAVKEVLYKDAESHGFVIIGWYDIGSRSIMNTKRITTNPEEMKGLKIRTMEDPILAGAVNAMGGIATPLAFGEVFTGMQQGTIDGLDHSPSALYDNRFHEVAKYLTLTEHFSIPGVVFVSKAWFDELSPENQVAMLKAGEAWTEKWNTEIWPQATDSAMKALAEEGVEIAEDIDKTPFIEATQSIVDDYLDKASEEVKALYELLIEVRDKY
jgi:tripartite ATP-independent transporter DctP family solute receptor